MVAHNGEIGARAGPPSNRNSSLQHAYYCALHIGGRRRIMRKKQSPTSVKSYAIRHFYLLADISLSTSEANRKRGILKIAFPLILILSQSLARK